MPDLNPAPTATDGKDTGTVGTAVRGSLTTVESHRPSQGFREGGKRSIASIDEEIARDTVMG